MLTDVINCQYRFNKIIIFGDWVQDKYRSIVNWYPVYIYNVYMQLCVCVPACVYITGTQYISLYMQLCLCVYVHACVCIYIYI